MTNEQRIHEGAEKVKSLTNKVAEYAKTLTVEARKQTEGAEKKLQEAEKKLLELKDRMKAPSAELAATAETVKKDIVSGYERLVKSLSTKPPSL